MEVRLKEDLLEYNVGDLIFSNCSSTYLIFYAPVNYKMWILVDLETKESYLIDSVEEKLAEWNETIVKIIPAEKLKLMEI